MRAARPAATPPTRPVGPLEQLVTDFDLDTVLVAMIDQQGRLKGKEYDAAGLAERLAAGSSLEVCGYLLGTDVDMTPAARGPFSWTSGFGDVEMLPGTERARLLPWLPATALVLADLVSYGAPHPLAPTTVLERQLRLLARLGVVPQVGIETEFVLYEGTLRDAEASGWRRLRPAACGNRDYALDAPGPVREFGRRLRQVLGAAGLPVEAVKGEGAPGQVEVTFPYGVAEEACIQHVLFKHAAKTVADGLGLTASFMAANPGGVGSGMHLHVSLHDGDGRSLLAADPERGTELSELGGWAVAGLLAAMGEFGPLWAPYVNSYKRLATDHSFAPTRLAWGRDNRTCAVRVVGHGPSLRLEVRLPGADANPLLALAAALAGIRHGITARLEPPPAVSGDAYVLLDAPPVPCSLQEAVGLFEASALAGELLGEPVVRHLARVAQMDLDHHAARVTDAEVERGLAQA
ncbi:glutamine synthetase family protein [Kitasatospora cineracea]|uniref:Glutamate--putrescine ligase n=1 Tax=Kitasatospora cineracea TaxID=88074 RepID=A0A8G1XDH8_9ACTN|nr:glutamine synthetase family protein [Kitasatospora cineracea]ROR46490.1 glutamate--putrescine ligase [Kitasatospora cineracea]